jgi:drug/metabolite transporter (DMT)-like permease
MSTKFYACLLFAVAYAVNEDSNGRLVDGSSVLDQSQSQSIGHKESGLRRKSHSETQRSLGTSIPESGHLPHTASQPHHVFAQAAPETWANSFYYLPVVMCLGILAFLLGSLLVPVLPPRYIGLIACMAYVFFSISIDLIMASLANPHADGKGQEYAFNPLAVILTVEAVKFITSGGIFLVTPSDHRGSNCSQLTLSDVKWLSLPAFIFTLNNILVFKAIGNNDISTFAVLRDTMILWTACFWKCWFFESLGWVRDIGITTIILGAMMMLFHRYDGGHWSWTFLWVLAMTLCNACGSVANEFALKRSKELDINIQNMVLYAVCILCSACFILLLDPVLLTGVEKFMAGFDRFTWILIGMQSLAGLMVSRLLKFADSIMKTAATSLRAPLLVCLAPLWVKSSAPLTTIVVICALLTSSGSFAYLSQPPLKAVTATPQPPAKEPDMDTPESPKTA